MQSHIQMPRLVLNNFTDQNHRLHYYDCENGRYGKCYPKSFYTEQDYYSEEVEELLNKEIESKLGKLVKFVKDTDFKNGTCVPVEFDDISRNYVISLMARLPILLDRINKKSVFFQFLPPKDGHDYAVVEGYNMVKNQRVFAESGVALIDNVTSEEFILPAGGIIQVGNSLICPITPYKAIMLELSNDIEDDQKIKIYLAEKKESIREINLAALEQETNRNKKYVVSTSKELLKTIVEAYERPK